MQCTVSPTGFTIRLKAVLFVLPCLLLIIPVAHAQTQSVQVVIDASVTHAPISKYVYGQFIEHIGDIVNRGLWAEMLDDRKFYHPVSGEDHPPVQGRRQAARRWSVVGQPGHIHMDRSFAFTGGHSPRITLDERQPRGIAQPGLALKADVAYTGRIVLSADQDVRVRLSLIRGEGEKNRQTMTLNVPKGPYETYDFHFAAGRSTEDARIEITAQGKGALWIGAVSLMPADHMSGFRKEVITLLSTLKSGVYRFPGGNFVSAHEWRDAIGDIDRRPPVMDPVWNAVQPNDVGTDEFMTLCRLLDVEPYITVNAGFGDAWSAAQLVEYANGGPDTPMGRLRAENGHPEPYHVKFWGIGNEAWGSWQMGAMALDQFVHKHNQFAKAMRKADPSIILIGSGAMPDAMTCSGESMKRTGKIVTEYLGPADWTGGLFAHCLDDMDLISEHFYAYSGQRFDTETGKQVPVDPGEPLVEWMRRPANHVKVKAEAYQDYLELIPGLREKRIPIVLAEWAYSRIPPNSYRVVPAYAWVFHEMFRHSERYQMANFTFVTSLLSMNRTDAVFNPAGLLFKLYSEHFGTVPVLVSGNAPQTASTHGPGGQDPEINAGSPTFPLDVAAALTEDGAALTLAVINPTENPATIRLDIRRVNLTGGGTLWRMAPDRLDAEIILGKDPEVRLEREELQNVPVQPAFAPFSVSLYRLEMEQSSREE